jgi:16S rRNA (guanine527-N7)-methyltransferase
MTATKAPEPSTAAVAVFGDRLPYAVQFAELLAGPGLDRGLIGPRELPRLWDRHLVNCAVLTDLLPDGIRIVDVGSGAGLPGLALACRRADLQIDLVDSLQRRVTFLAEAVAMLGLADRVRVVHGRAEDAVVRRQVGDADFVTARAVAPLSRLVAWCLPLLRPGGELLAIRGMSAMTEMEQYGAAQQKAPVASLDLIACDGGVLSQSVMVVRVRRDPWRGGAMKERGQR